METALNIKISSERASRWHAAKAWFFPLHVLLRLAAIISNAGKLLLLRSNVLSKLLFIPGIEKLRWSIGKLRAYNEFSKARKKVPAYRDFLVSAGALDLFDLRDIPVIDKNNYVKAYSLEKRCVNGILPEKDVIIDESSGSSGMPTNWARGAAERKMNKRMMTLALDWLIGTQPKFIINAFALGPWATGINITMSFAKNSILKSLGPDIPKIINTLKIIGPGRNYVIMGYPPFLKMLVDSNDISWKEYNIIFIFGGEAMSESMREYITAKGIRKIYGSYGASDLELNLAAENDFTINLRKLIIRNKALANDLVKHRGITPMIFRFNPADFFMETDENGELLISICRPGYLSPKIRYNIHDLGHVVRIPELKAILSKHNIQPDEIGNLDTDLPLLFHYGRSDMAVAWFGCKITPSEIEQAIFSNKWLSGFVRTFSLSVTEDERMDKRLSVKLELNEGLNAKDFAASSSATAHQIYGTLKKNNQDFLKSISMVSNDLLPTIEFCDYQSGHFADNDIRIKLKYIH